MHSKALTIGFVLVLCGSVTSTFLSSAQAQVNSYTNTASGKWETGANWSLGTAPSTSDAADLITNTVSKTVTIDATTSGSFSNSLTINSLFLGAPAGSVNELLLNNAGTNVPLRILNSLVITNGGLLYITNSAVEYYGFPYFDYPPGVNPLYLDGALTLASGVLTTTNSICESFRLDVGLNGTGTLTIQGGEMVSFSISVGNNSGSQGTLNLSGGTLQFANCIPGAFDLEVGGAPGALGTVLVTGGTLIAQDAPTLLGVGGAGEMTVTGGTVLMISLRIGSNPGSDGTLTVSGSGYLESSDFIEAGVLGGTTGTVWVTGGTLVVTNGLGFINIGSASLTLSNGSVLCSSLAISTNIQSQGTLTVSGGTLTVLSQLNGSTTLATNFQAFVHITGGTVNIGTNTQFGAGIGSTDALQVVGGQLIVTNGVIGIGNDGTSTNGVGVGHMMVSNGTVLASTILLGSSAGGHGDLTISSGGTVDFGFSSAGTNTALVANDLTVDGGELILTNGTIYGGQTHPGGVTLSNGLIFCEDIYIGYNDNGSMLIDGGTLSVVSLLHVGEDPDSTGVVWMTGGDLLATNNTTFIGNDGVGQMTISNGTVTASRVVVSNSSNPGTLSIQGGTLTGPLTISPQGRFVFGQGQLTVMATTNSNGQPFVVGDGIHAATMTLLGGTHAFDAGLTVNAGAMLNGCGTINGAVINLGTITNECGTLNFAGLVTNNGTIVVSSGASTFFAGPVVNNGLINANNGTVSFSTYPVGPGTVLAPPPVAGFTASPTMGTAPLLVNFTDASSGIITGRLWTFDDEGTSPLTSPSHTYSNAGIYSVTLTVFGYGGLSMTNLIVHAVLAPTNQALLIVSAPVVTNALLNIPNVSVVMVGETNVFNVGATGPVGQPLSYQWQFGDDVTNAESSLSTALHVYATTNCGPATASVTVSAGGASITSNLTVAVACQLAVTKLQAKLNFAKANSDSCSLTATPELSPDFLPGRSNAGLGHRGSARDVYARQPGTRCERPRDLSARITQSDEDAARRLDGDGQIESWFICQFMGRLRFDQRHDTTPWRYRVAAGGAHGWR